MSEKIELLEVRGSLKPNIHQRILAIMEDIDYIAKGEKTVNGQYRFVDHDSVTAKVRGFLIKHRVNAVPSIPIMLQDGNRSTVKMTMTFINADHPQDQYAVEFWGQGIDPGDKGVGKATSYACKYALLKSFHIETGDDPDRDAKPVYEPPECQEFDYLICMWSDKDKERVAQFLAHSSAALKKHVEDVKREAVTRFEDFCTAFKKWSPGVKTRKKDET